MKVKAKRDAFNFYASPLSVRNLSLQIACLINNKCLVCGKHSVFYRHCRKNDGDCRSL
jgi:hypothetical protein